MKPIKANVDEIRGARSKLRYSQKYMADALGISVGAYRKKESGKTPFRDHEKIILADVLKFDLNDFNDYLFDGMMPPGVIKSTGR